MAVFISLRCYFGTILSLFFYLLGPLSLISLFRPSHGAFLVCQIVVHEGWIIICKILLKGMSRISLSIKYSPCIKTWKWKRYYQERRVGISGNFEIEVHIWEVNRNHLFPTKINQYCKSNMFDISTVAKGS